MMVETAADRMGRTHTPLSVSSATSRATSPGTARIASLTTCLSGFSGSALTLRGWQFATKITCVAFKDRLMTQLLNRLHP